MSQNELIAFYVFALTAAITPGPSNVLVMNAGLRGGVTKGFPCAAGVVLGMGILMAASVLGLGSLLIAQPVILNFVRWLGAAMLLWLAFKIATAPAMRPGEPIEPVGFWRALMFQWVNPKSWVISASAAASYGVSGDASILSRAFLLAATFMAAAAPSVTVWLLFGTALQGVLTRPRIARYVYVVMGLTLAASVVMIL